MQRIAQALDGFFVHMTKQSRNSLIVICASLALLAASTSAQAATKVGKRDMTFGHKGFVFPRDGRGYKYTDDESTATDPQGRLLICVPTFSEKAANRGIPDGGFMLKYDRRGHPVNSFGIHGRVNRLTPRAPLSMVADSTGRPLLLSFAISKGHKQFPTWHLTRLTTRGKRDKSFGDRGSIELALTTERHSAPQVAPLPSGRVAVWVGTNANDKTLDPNKLTIFNDAGRPDSTFDADGSQTEPFAASSVSEFADGKLLVSGGGAGKEFLANRLLADGSVDPTWGDAGSFHTEAIPSAIWKKYGGREGDPPGTLPTEYWHSGIDSTVLQAGGAQLMIQTDLPESSSGEHQYGFEWTIRLTADGALDQPYGSDGAAFVDNLDRSSGALDDDGFSQSSLALSDGRVYSQSIFYDLHDETGTEYFSDMLGASGRAKSPGTFDFHMNRYSASAVFDPKVEYFYTVGDFKKRFAIARFRVR